jgi:hypothetical protein
MGKRNKPVEPAQQGAGLKMTAHPLLLDTAPAAPQSKKDRYKPMQPKFASIKVRMNPSYMSLKLTLFQGKHSKCPNPSPSANPSTHRRSQSQSLRFQLNCSQRKWF